MAFTWLNSIFPTFDGKSGTDIEGNIKDTCDELQTNVDTLDGSKAPLAHTHVSTDVSYDNTVSGLTATDVKGAVDEVNAKIPTEAFNIILSKIGVAQMTTSTPVTLTGPLSAVKLAVFDAAPHSATGIVEADVVNDYFVAKILGVYKISGVLAIEAGNGITVTLDLYANDSTPTSVTPGIVVEGKGTGNPVFVGYNTIVDVDEINTQLWVRVTSSSDVTVNSATVILEKTLYEETI